MNICRRAYSVLLQSSGISSVALKYHPRANGNALWKFSLTYKWHSSDNYVNPRVQAEAAEAKLASLTSQSPQIL